MTTRSARILQPQLLQRLLLPLLLLLPLVLPLLQLLETAKTEPQYATTTYQPVHEQGGLKAKSARHLEAASSSPPT